MTQKLLYNPCRCFLRFTKVYLIRHKNEAFDMFLSYKAKDENQLNRKIQIIRYDRGGEYVAFNDFCEKRRNYS